MAAHTANHIDSEVNGALRGSLCLLSGPLGLKQRNQAQHPHPQRRSGTPERHCLPEISCFRGFFYFYFERPLLQILNTAE